MKPLYDRQTILQLIPQRPPIVEVDAFYGADERSARTGLTVEADNLLVDGDTLSEAGLLEHMAQSAAARAGYIARSIGKEVALGFIGAINNASFGRLPRIGEQITTTVELHEEVMNIALVEVKSCVGEEVIGQCSLKIFTEQKA